MFLDRRRFLNGSWPRPGRQARAVDVRTGSCGILVQARPDRLGEALEAVMALGRIELVGRDLTGRLTLALPAADQAGVARTLNTISQLPGVLSATLTAGAAAWSRPEERS
jgi:nitrate reductase NapAB chaperone NapD